MTINKIINNESALSVFNKLNEVITLNNIFTCPENHGWDNSNTVTVNTTAIQDAVNSGDPVFFGPKQYEINSAIIIPDNTKIFGCGSESIIYTQSNISIFELQGQRINIENITFKGNDTGANQRGISAVGNGSFTLYYLSNKVSNCDFIDLKGAGIYVTDIIGTSGGNNSEGAIQAVNCRAISCEVGFHCAQRGEYNSFTGCIANNCVYGFRNRGGNNNWLGGSMTGCTYGVYLEAGTNDGHGCVVGAKINHNTNNIYISSLANGFVFSGCMVYVGDVILLTSDSIRFIGCNLSTLSNLTVTTCTNTKFSSCQFVTNPTSYNLTGTAPLWLDNDFKAGKPTYVTGSIQNGGQRVSVGGTIANFTTDANNSGTGETDLYSYTTPAGSLSLIGESIEFDISGTFNDVTATGQLKIYFGGNIIGDTGALTISATSGWSATGMIIRTGASTARSVVRINTPGASTAIYTSQTDITSLTFTNSNVWKITGTAGGAGGGNNDITAKLGSLYWWGASI